MVMILIILYTGLAACDDLGDARGLLYDEGRVWVVTAPS